MVRLGGSQSNAGKDSSTSDDLMSVMAGGGIFFHVTGPVGWKVTNKLGLIFLQPL